MLDRPLGDVGAIAQRDAKPREFRPDPVAFREVLVEPGRDARVHALRHCLFAEAAQLQATCTRARSVVRDRRAHERLLDAFAATGRLKEGEEHLAATARRYESEAQDWAPIGHAWRAAKLRHAGPVLLPAAAAAEVRAAPDLQPPVSTRRASLAVMPFAERTPGGVLRGGLGDGLAHDLITRLAKLRSLFVIAQGTVFALDERQVGAEDAGRRLSVDYLASGSLRREAGNRLTVTVQVAAVQPVTLHPTNELPVVGVAVNVTMVPTFTVSAQSVGQLMPAGAEVTVPEPTTTVLSAAVLGGVAVNAA